MQSSVRYHCDGGEVALCTYMTVIIVAFANKAMKELHIHKYV